MRIGIWNVEKAPKGKFEGIREVIGDAAADVWVFTEPPQTPLTTGKSVESPRPKGQKETWIRIEGAGVEALQFEGADNPTMAEVRLPGDLIVIGSVLPWLSASSHVAGWKQTGVVGGDLFVDVVAKHAARVRLIQRQFQGATVIWAGDFNQTLSGPNNGGSDKSRDALAFQLRGLQMDAWNAHCDHLNPALRAIDLVCGPPGAGTVVRQFGNKRLSDHAGYVVDVNMSNASK